MKTTFGKHFLLCILGGSISLSGYAADGTTSIASGFDSTSGNYGTSSNTSILTIPVIGKYETDSWMFKLTVPYLQVTTLSGVIPGVGGGKMNKGGATKINATTQSGLGDIVAAGTYFAIDGDEWGPGLDLTAKIKFPTANKDAGLGTGETDYALQMDVYQSIDKLTVTGSLGRKFLGSSATLPLNDIFYGSVGANYKVSDKTGAGISLDAAQASSAIGYNVLELSVYVNHKIDKRRKVQGYLLKGLANGSPDTGLGMLFTLAL
jgi:hypothetical protein